MFYEKIAKIKCRQYKALYGIQLLYTCTSIAMPLHIDRKAYNTFNGSVTQLRAWQDYTCTCSNHQCPRLGHRSSEDRITYEQKIKSKDDVQKMQPVLLINKEGFTLGTKAVHFINCVGNLTYALQNTELAGELHSAFVSNVYQA